MSNLIKLSDSPNFKNATDNISVSQKIASAARDAGMRLSADLGDRGPGYDNTGPINDWLTAIKSMNGRKGGLLNPWTSDVATPLNFGDLSGVTIMGVPGISRLRGGADYALVQLGHMDDVLFDGVGFVSTHTNSNEDGGKSIVYSFQKRVRRVRFERCYFSNPNSFTSALTFYATIGPNNPGNDPAEPGFIDGLDIFRNEFNQVGRICMTMMNRSQTADRFKKLRGVRIIGNQVRRAGAAAPSYESGTYGLLHGMFVSMDGCGEDVLIADNSLEQLQGLGIEIVCQTGVSGHRWSNVNILRNTFRDFSRGVHMLSIDDGNGSGGFTGLKIEGNRPVGDVTGARHSNLFGMDASCVLRDNEFPGQANDQAVNIRRAGKWLSEENRYIGIGDRPRYAAIVESGAIVSIRDRFECVGAGTYATVRFLSAAATGSNLTGATLVKGTAGVIVDQVSGATNNFITSYSTDTSAEVQNDLTYTMPSDADQTLSSTDAINYRYIRINPPVDAQGAALTVASPRTLTLKARSGFNPTIFNTTNQALIINGQTFLFPQQRITFQSVGTTLAPVGTGYYSSSFNAGGQGLFLGFHRLYIDGNGGLRSYLQTSANPNPVAATSGRPVGQLGPYGLAALPTTGVSAGQRSTLSDYDFTVEWNGDRWIPTRPPRGTLAQLNTMRDNWPTPGLLSGQSAFATNCKALATGGVVETGSASGTAVSLVNGTWRIIGTNIVAST